ncbi:MAG: pilin [Patescibacteria group bacterium]
MNKLLLFLIKTQIASAQTDPFTEPAGTLYSPGGGSTGGGIDFSNPLGVYSWQALIDRVIKGLIMLATPIAVIMVLWAAYLYITSGGDTEKVKRAHQTILWVVIGYGVLLLADGISYFMQGLLLGY